MHTRLHGAKEKQNRASQSHQDGLKTDNKQAGKRVCRGANVPPMQQGRKEGWRACEDWQREEEWERKRGRCLQMSLGSLLQIWLNYLLARRKEGVSKVFNSKQTPRRVPKLLAIRKDGMRCSHASLTSPGNVIITKLKSEEKKKKNWQQQGRKKSAEVPQAPIMRWKWSERLIDLMPRLQRCRCLTTLAIRRRHGSPPTHSRGHAQGTDMLFW